MGKKQRIVPQPDEDGMLDTGIYQQQVGPPKQATAEDWKIFERMEEINAWSASEHLANIRLALRPIIEPFVERIEPPLKAHLPGKQGVLDIGDGPLLYHQIPEINEPTVAATRARDAIEALHQIKVIQHGLGKDENIVFKDTLRFGQLLERIHVRPYEPRALTGKRVLEGSSKGAETANQGRAEMYAEKAKQYSAEVEDRMKKGVKYTPATDRVGQSHGVTGRTVRKYVKNPSPRNRGHKKGRKVAPRHS